MIEHVVSECLKSKANQVIVVFGHDSEKVEQALKDYRCDFVANKEFAKGQSSSVKMGLSKVSTVCRCRDGAPWGRGAGGPSDH